MDGCLDTTTATGFTIATLWAKLSRTSIRTTICLPLNFTNKWWSYGDKKMKKTHKIIGIGTAEEFFKRSRARAKKIDRGEKIRPEMRLMFEDPADLIRAVSAERIRLILAARLKPGPVSDLALF